MKRGVAVAMLVAMFLFSSLTFTVTSSAEADGYELLIIAPGEFIDALRPLKDFKDATNRPTLLLSLEEIYVNFHGSDIAEMVKKCIANYEKTYGIEYVMLVGDSDKFPVRYIYGKNVDIDENTVLSLSYVPTDLYYADLYYEGTGDFCNWDANGNGFYGESLYYRLVEPELNIDDLDLRPDVAVGRVPVSDITEIRNYVDKTISYERYCSPDIDWFNRALFVSGDDSGMYAPEIEIEQLNKIADLLGFLGFDVIKLYDPDYCEPLGIEYDDAPTPANINTYLNDGVGFVNFHCHGSTGGWDYVYRVPRNMTGLSNEDCLPIIYSMSCNIGAYAPRPHIGESYIDVNDEICEPGPMMPFPDPVPMSEFIDPPKPNPLQNSATDTESPTEHFLVYHLKGAIASIAPSSLMWIASEEDPHPLNDGFFDGYEEDYRVLGDVWNQGINYYCDNYWANPATGSGADMALLARYHLFGDPSLVVGGLPPKLAIIDIKPNTLNLKSKGKWITTYITLPEDYNVEDIDVETILLDGTIPAGIHPTEIGDYDEDDIPDLMVKFDRAPVIKYILGLGFTDGEVILTVTGELLDGTLFEGTDTVVIKT